MGLRVIEVGRVYGSFVVDMAKPTLWTPSPPQAVIAGDADGAPKFGDWTIEMIRHLKIARDTALEAQTQAMETLETLLGNAPQPLLERVINITGKMTPIRAIATLRPDTPRPSPHRPNWRYAHWPTNG